MACKMVNVPVLAVKRARLLLLLHAAACCCFGAAARSLSPLRGSCPLQLLGCAQCWGSLRPYTTLLCWCWSWQGFAEGEKEDVVAQLQLWWRHEAFGRIKEYFGSAPPPPSAQAPSHDVVL